MVSRGSAAPVQAVTRLLSGNEAIAEAAIAAGVRFYAGYPITPSSEIGELMARRLPEVGGKFIQMEDEIASLAACIGASLAGVKAMDATSGPGFSLKAENLGLAIMLEVPLVLVNVQRLGPSSGAATFSSQGDVMMARWGTHGDHPAIVLSPSSVRECFDLTVKAVNLSERFRMPVVLLSEQSISHLHEKATLAAPVEITDRPRASMPRERYQPYLADGTGVPPFAPFGAGYHWYANSSMHDQAGFEATGNPDVARVLVERMMRKVRDHQNDIVCTVHEGMEDAEVALLAFGATARAARGAIKLARQKGIKAGLIRMQTVWPFPDDAVEAAAGRLKALVVPEMNYGQLIEKVQAVAGGKTKVVSLTRYDARLITPEQMVTALEEVVRG